jgi:hypothetical protein
MGLWLLLNRNRDEHMAGRQRQQVHELLLQHCSKPGSLGLEELLSLDPFSTSTDKRVSINGYAPDDSP